MTQIGTYRTAILAIVFSLAPYAARAEFYIDDSGMIYERSGNQYLVADHHNPLHIYLPDDQVDDLRALEGASVFVKPNRQATVDRAYYDDSGELVVVYSYGDKSFRTTANRIAQATRQAGR